MTPLLNSNVPLRKIQVRFLGRNRRPSNANSAVAIIFELLNMMK